MTKRAPNHVIRRIKRLQDMANFTNYAGSELRIGGNVYGPFGDEVGDAVREATKMYRDSWVNPEFEELLAWAEGK